MDIAKIKSKALKAWLPLFDGVDVLCRFVPQSRFDALQEQCMEVSFDPKTHQKAKKLNNELFRTELAKEVVEDWRGLVDGDQAFPCTAENIEFMMCECTEFRLLVLDAPLSLEKMVEMERAEQEKNSWTTSGQRLTTQA